LIRLFTESPGLLGCYYSFDYSEQTFAAFFHDETLAFNRMHAERALAGANGAAGAPNVEALLPLAHALTAMTDNFVFRYCTGRDETAALERSARTDVARLLAQIRVRAFSLPDNEIGVSLLPPASKNGPAQRPRFITPVGTPAHTHKRLPKRADSTASYGALTEAALRVMNRLSYDEMRIKDIEDEGGVSRGSIYHYFEEKRHLTILLLRERLAAMHTRLEATTQRPPASQFRDLETVISVFLDEYQANPGILRVLYRLEQDDAEAADMLAAYRQIWARAIGDLCGAHLGAEARWRSTLIIVGYAILAMVERFAYDLHVLPFPEIAGRIPPPERARFLAAIWTRVLFLARPKSTEFRGRDLLPQIQA
jgi:AcrR family transcriptional regulator